MRSRIFAEGAIANDKGDLYGNSPFRIIRFGALIIPIERAAFALHYGWRAVDKAWPNVAAGEIAGSEACDPDFAWLERTAGERDAM